jgi:nicotinamidase-related amidase
MNEHVAGATGLIITDPYNEFISEGGRIWSSIKDVAETVGTLDNMRQIAQAARTAGIRVFFSHHRRWRPGDFDGWAQLTDGQARTERLRLFPADGWGGQWHPDFIPEPGDVVLHEHWAQSGFANTDLDLQLKQHGIHKIVLIGLIAHTCIESTGRFGMELGYHVTLVRDATAAPTMEMMRAAHELNGPTFAHTITDTKTLVEQF